MDIHGQQIFYKVLLQEPRATTYKRDSEKACSYLHLSQA